MLVGTFFQELLCFNWTINCQHFTRPDRSGSTSDRSEYTGSVLFFLPDRSGPSRMGPKFCFHRFVNNPGSTGLCQFGWIRIQTGSVRNSSNLTFSLKLWLTISFDLELRFECRFFLCSCELMLFNFNFDVASEFWMEFTLLPFYISSSFLLFFYCIPFLKSLSQLHKN